MAIKAKYQGDGSVYILGVPARDLTDDEWARMSKEQREDALNSGLYKLTEKQAKETPAKTGE